MSKLDRAQVAGITARLMSELKQSPATATPLPQLSTAYRSAALVSSFSVDGLEQQGAGEAEVSAVIRDSSAVVQSDGSLRWVLKPDLRMAAVRQIASDVPLPSALASVTDAPDDPVQRMITNYANGTAPKLDDQDTQQLGASFRVVEWFGEFLPDAPSKDEIAHRLEYRGFVQPFHDLVGENFQGREDELDQLSDYVGVRRASSLKERLARVARRVRNFSERPPLMITGPGGIGKSTLIAKFIVDHTDVGDRPMPFVYIDFDRPLMDAGEPVVVLYDGLHQLSLQFPEARASLMSLRQSWEERFIEAVGTSTRVASKQQTLSGWRPGAPLPRIADRLRIQLVEEFVRVLSVLDVDDRQLLLVLDTFEQVQARSSAELLAMWELLERVQEGHPLLRVVISGRVEYGAMVDDLAGDSKSARERFVTENLPLAGLNRKESESYLVGAELPAKAARQIVKHVVDPKRGASPLTLRVAAAVWAKQRERGATSAEPDDRFWERLKTGRIQAELIARYLHYVDGEIGKLAGPALVLRRLTPDVLINVVAGPAGVDVPSVERAGYLIDELRREVSMLVASRTDHRELVPRQEVQQQVVALMRDLEGDMLRRIHERAIEYFGGIADRLGVDDPAGLDALADEIYHRLALRQDETLIRQRWDARLAGRLDEAVLALDPAERALLATLSHREISASLRREVSQRTWETGAGKRVREYIEVGLYDDALGLLHERTVRSAGSELYLLETVVLLAIGDKLQARAVALAGIDSFDAGGNSAVQIDLLVALVRVELAIGDLDAAGETLERATVLARDRDDGVRLLALQILRTSFVADGETDSEIDRSAIVELVDAIDDAELRLHLPLLTAAATTVGRDHPRVILHAVRLGALAGLTDTENRRLARALADFDGRVSRARSEEPGMVARALRLDPKPTVTETWSALLSDLSTLVPDFVPRALTDFDVRPGDPVLDELIAVLGGEDVDVPGADESSEPRGSAVNLSGSQRSRLLGALTAAFDLGDLDVLASDIDMPLQTITPFDRSHKEIVFALVEATNQRARTGDLILAARAARPADTELFALATELGLATLRLVEPTTFAPMFGILEHQIASIAWGEQIRGTGFLVAPDLVLTSTTCVEDVLDGRVDDADLRVIFGSGPRGAGTAFGLSRKEWLVNASITPSDGRRSGHALLRLDGYPGDEPISTFGHGRSAARRGFVRTSPDSGSDPAAGGRAFWFDARPDGLVVATGELSESSPDRFVASGKSEHAGTGGPLFGHEFRLLGMIVGASESGALEALPIASIIERIDEAGYGGHVGQDLL